MFVRHVSHLTERSAMQRKNSNAPRESGWLRPIDASRRGDKLRAWEHTADVLISMKASTFEIAFCPICGCASQHGMDHIQGGRLRRTSAPEEALLSKMSSNIGGETDRKSNFEGPLRTLMAVQEHWNETAQRQRHVQSRASTAYGSKTIEVRSRVQKADMCELS